MGVEGAQDDIHLIKMTGKEFYKYHWKAMEVVEWVNPYKLEVIQCCILAVDFMCHTFHLVPIADIGYEEKEFWCAVSQVRKIVKNQKLVLSKSLTP